MKGIVSHKRYILKSCKYDGTPKLYIPILSNILNRPSCTGRRALMSGALTFVTVNAGASAITVLTFSSTYSGLYDARWNMIVVPMEWPTYEIFSPKKPVPVTDKM